MKTLHSYGITSCTDLHQLHVNFYFKHEGDDYHFVHHLDSFLAGSKEKNGDLNLMTFCVENTVRASTAEHSSAQLPALRGIGNIGNSCYINSVLQALFTFPCVTQSFNGTGIAKLNDKIETVKYRKDAPLSQNRMAIRWLSKLIPLQESIAHIFTKLNSQPNTNSIMTDFRSKLFLMELGGLVGLTSQQDAAEIIPPILEAAGYEMFVQSTIKGSYPKEGSGIVSYSHRQPTEPLFLVPLALVLENESLEKRQQPIELSILINDFMNSKNPDSCTEAWMPEENNPEIKVFDFCTERRLITSLPEMIGFHFKRFNGERQKIQREILFPENDIIDMTAHLDGDLNPDGQNILYRLKAIVIHSGPNITRGHYYTHANRNGKWYELNDDRVFNLENPSKKDAYIAFFERIKV